MEALPLCVELFFQSLLDPTNSVWIVDESEQCGDGVELVICD